MEESKELQRRTLPVQTMPEKRERRCPGKEGRRAERLPRPLQDRPQTDSEKGTNINFVKNGLGKPYNIQLDFIYVHSLTK